jgi:hypothetical protein
MIKFTLTNDDGDEEEHELPSVFEVCDNCEGHGTHMNESMRQHGYTKEEFDETFHDDDDRAEYFKRGGIYDVECEACKGLRVVPVVDESNLTTEQKAIFERYEQSLEDDAEYERICASERRMGA